MRLAGILLDYGLFKVPASTFPFFPLGLSKHPPIIIINDSIQILPIKNNMNHLSLYHNYSP